jgi:hypothetical protein
MKGLMRRAATALCGAALLAGGVGCYHWREIVDPCYPQRYEYMARQEVHAAFTPQVQNGHVLDQTVWNYEFEAGTEKLTPGGLDHLAYLARRRPHPDGLVYLQTAQDVTYDPAAPDKLVGARNELDTKRVQAIYKYLMAQASGRGCDFRVEIHDPADVSLPAAPFMTINRVPPAGPIGDWFGRLVGRLPMGAAQSPTGGGGAGGGGGGGAPR